MPSVLDRTVGFLADKLDRRGFLAKSAVFGSAVVAAPLEFGLRPTSAYAAVCSCSGSNCDCGSQCCDGYTEFCCTLNGANACPPGTITAGWWKVDGSQFCGGAARYYLDCNAQCGGCGCGGKGVCGGNCSGTGCGCAQGNCGNRKSGCTLFRYGQCNQGVACVGPIVCRVVTCTPPWNFDPACGTSARTDEATRYHNKPCLEDPFGSLGLVQDVGGAIRVAGWAIANSDYDRAGIRIFLDTDFVYHGVAELPRPDVKAAYPAASPNTGYDVTIQAPAGRRLVCVWATDRRTGADALIGMQQVDVAAPFGSLDSVTDVGGAIRLTGWTVANSAWESAGTRVFLDTDFVYHGVTDQPRPDVQRLNPAAPATAGFDITVKAAPGKRLVCMWGVDRRTNSTGLIGFKEIVVAPVPVGKIETVTSPALRTIRVTGWALDPVDPGRACVVRILIDGAEAGRVTTSIPRPDAASQFPNGNPNCGYQIDVPVTGGVTHELCAEILTRQGNYASLGCTGATAAG